MNSSPLTYQDIVELIELIKSSSQFSEFRIRHGDFEIELRRGSAGSTSVPGTALAAAPLAHAATAPITTPAMLADADAVASWPAGAVVIRSPMVGSFFRSPEPGAAPFVCLGQAVQADTTVCIIEVMKLMNSIRAGSAGRVIDVLVADGAAVAYGQPLIVIQAG